MSQDPWEGDLANPQSLNKYSYVLNNPLRYTDPTGMCVWDLCFVETSLVATAIVTLAGYIGLEGIMANIPPSVESSPYFNPSGTTESFGATSLPSSNEFGGTNTTTLPGTKMSPWIEQILAPSFEKKANIMTQKEKSRSINNPKQDKKLSKGEIERLKKAGIDLHDGKLKFGNSRQDLFKDKRGNIYTKPKSGNGSREETEININDF